MYENVCALACCSSLFSLHKICDDQTECSRILISWTSKLGKQRLVQKDIVIWEIGNETDPRGKMVWVIRKFKKLRVQEIRNDIQVSQHKTPQHSKDVFTLLHLIKLLHFLKNNCKNNVTSPFWSKYTFSPKTSFIYFKGKFTLFLLGPLQLSL